VLSERNAIKLLNGRKLIARDLASTGKVHGTLRISRLIDLQKRKSVITRLAQLAPIHSDPFALIDFSLFC
jgi:hypothetical protein